MARDDRNPVEEELTELSRGRADRTPFVLFFGVNALLLVLALVIAAIALVVFWLV